MSVSMELRTVGVEHLTNLQTLEVAKANSWIHSSLATMTSLRTVSIDGIRASHHIALARSLEGLVYLRSLALKGVSLLMKVLVLPGHRHLEGLMLRGPLKDAENSDIASYSSCELPSNLVSLEPKDSELLQDPLLLLECLQYLRWLKVGRDAYKGVELVCSADKLPKLQHLVIVQLSNMKRWSVQEGGMPCLCHLKLWSCDELEALPDRLWHLCSLQRLEIANAPGKLRERLRRGTGTTATRSNTSPLS